VYAGEPDQHSRRSPDITPAHHVNIRKSGARQQVSTGGVWEPFTRATDSNNRIIRRSMEGATATDMTVIAQQAALDYERKLDEAELNDSEEE